MINAEPTPLNSIAEIVRGVTFAKNEASQFPHKEFLPVLRAGNIQAELLLSDDLLFVPEKNISAKQRLRAGDIVMCTSSGSTNVVGKSAFLKSDWDGSIGAFCVAVRANREVCSPSYLFHYFQTSAFRFWTRNSSGVNIKNIRKSELDSVLVPLPVMDKQRKIAAILDKADAIRRKREKTLALADDLLKSAFLEMFGDPAENPNGFKVEKIEHHLNKMRPGTQSGPFGSALKKHEYTNTGIPVWGVANVQANRFLGEAELFIPEKKYEQLRRYSVCCGDVLISRAGTVGRMCIARPIVEQSIIGTNLIRVALDPDSLLSEYFVALFTYLPHRLGALKANEKKSAFTFLNPRKLKGIEIPIPPKSLQKDYRNLVNKVDFLTRQGKNHLEGLDELFGSLSQRAFSEKL